MSLVENWKSKSADVGYATRYKQLQNDIY